MKFKVDFNSIDYNRVKSLIGKILEKEKEFLNEKQLPEGQKVKEIKRIIEDEVSLQ